MGDGEGGVLFDGVSRPKVLHGNGGALIWEHTLGEMMTRGAVMEESIKPESKGLSSEL